MRRNGGDVEGTDAEDIKGHGGRYSAARVQTLLEQNADAVYGAAAFFVTLAVLILALTPTVIEVDAGGNPVRATHLKLNLPSAFRVKLSKIAHSVKDTLSHVDWTPRSELGVSMGSGLANAGVGIVAGGGAGGGGDALSSDIIRENRALRTEVTELQGTVARLQVSLQTTACLSITAAQEGLCLPPLQASSAAAARASTRDKAVLRPAGYRREHKRWAAAKDHWATQYVNFKSPQRRIGFEINTHNPDTEDIYISRAVHRREIWDKPVFNVLKYVLASKGLPPGRVLDIGGNIGYFTMWALAMGHKVTTFEPMDFNVRYIVTSIDANKFGANHTLYQNAVGNQAGRLALQPTNKQNRGNFQVQMVNGAAGEPQGEYGFDYVDTVRLDDVVDEDVHLIKIDVEGFEHKVLDGARKLLCSRLVRYIEFEFTTAKSDGDCLAEQVLCWFATSIKRPTKTIKRLAKTIKRPTNTIKRPTNAIKRPNNTIKRPTNTIKRPTNTTKKPTNTIKKPTDTMKRPGVVLVRDHRISHYISGCCRARPILGRGRGTERA
jgi:FkbM family methyltransferase